MPQETTYTLLYDGQCVICRHLIEKFVKPKLSNSLSAKPYQEALFEKTYPEQELQRCKKEILLVKEETQEFIGGVKAVSKTLDLTKQLYWLQIILNMSFLGPFTWFGYRMVAWHRYSWFIVPPYLRCAECEIEVPKVWNFVFFLLLALITLGGSLYFCYSWFDSFRGAAPILFSLIKKEPNFLSLASVLAGLFAILFIQAGIFFTNKKILGYPKFESNKQYFIVNAGFTTLLTALTPLAIYLGSLIAANTSALKYNLIFLLLSSLYILILLFTQLVLFWRWEELGQRNKVKDLIFLFLDFIFRCLAPFGLMYFI